MKNLIRYLWIFIVILHITKAWFERCDYNAELSQQNPQMYVNSPDYPKRYPSGSSCRYQLIAPINYLINLECNMNIDKNGCQCDSEYLYVSVKGDRNFKNSLTFCGAGNFKKQSTGNQLTLAYTSSSQNNSGSFTCLATIIPPCDCGWSFSTKIVGGVEARVNEYPFIARIMYYQSDIFCGGTIISNRFVLTAAHCIKQLGSNDLIVRVGEHNLTAKSPYFATYSINYVKIHERYVADPDGDANDIALLGTSQNIIFSEGVGPACLPFLHQYNLLVGYPADIMGWGTTSFAGAISTVLLKATVRVQENSNCAAEHPKILNSQICAYGYRKDTCQYDSGGPLIYRNSRMFLIGIVSYGKFCGSTAPGMNTRITSYLDWIQSNTRANFCKKRFQLKFKFNVKRTGS